MFTTVSADGVANSIYATCVSKFGDDKLLIADNFFAKTKANLLNGSGYGCLLFITGEGKAYQVKGRVERLTTGPEFDDMKTWNGNRPGHAVAVLHVEEVFSGAEKLL
ncbi:MAG: pyridoxamine 5'-phosphate oxidase family protein [Victivallales bacterium]|nr:pyridoxamine 5'-phosphate oxidase family protein [Victivallales bacterium]